ncbi:MAG TPA: hypothetical protein VK179_06410 [Bacteroidales bacterium]|nr:hypothetical protein [Bacteroidales bacterium]
MKPIRHILLLISILYMFSCDKEDISSGQKTTFIKYFTDFPEFKAADVVVTDNGYAVLGTATTIDNSKYICLIKTDEYGNTTDSIRTYGVNARNTAWCLKALDDGGYAILGSYINDTTEHKAVYFIRTNSAGDTLWTKKIRRNGDLEAVYFDVSDNGSFFMTGYYDTDSLNLKKQIWCMGIDESGNTIGNQRLYGFPSGDDMGTHLQILPDERLVITGYVTHSQGKMPFIIKTKENTVFADAWELSGNANESGNCIRALDGDNFLLLTTYSTSGQEQVTLKRVHMSSSLHEINWQKSFDNGTRESGRDLILNGQTFYILSTSALNTSNSSIAITTTNPEGLQSNRVEFGSESQLLGSSFKQTADGGFIITGTNQHAEANNTAITLIKTDSHTGL